VQILIVTVTVKIHTESTLQEDSNIFNPNYICHLVEEWLLNMENFEYANVYNFMSLYSIPNYVFKL